MNPDFFTLLAAAAGGSFHCAGMCGGFVLSASSGLYRGRLLRAQALYHTGKTTSYIFLGSLAGLGGRWLLSWGPSMGSWIAAGAAAVLFGIGVSMLLPPRKTPTSRQQKVEPPKLWRSDVREPGLVAGVPATVRPLVLGVVSGCLPCPLVLAFLARAASAGSPPAAMATMAVLGFGTFPLLAVVAWTGSLFTPLLRARMGRVSGVCLIGLGLFTAWRGFFGGCPCCEWILP